MTKRNGVILVTIGIIFFGFIFYFLPCANSEIAVSNYDEVKNTEQFRLYIDGVVMGLGLANTYMESKGQQPLYCRPKALTTENYLDILRQCIEKNRSRVEALPFIGVEMLLLEGLIETFPCKK